MDSIAIEQAIRLTVPGQTWYYCGRGFGARWATVEVAKVTKTQVVFTNGVRIQKTTRVDNHGSQYFPPTVEMVEVYEAQELKDEAMTRYKKVMARLEETYRGLTPAKLRLLAVNLENAIELSYLEKP